MSETWLAVAGIVAAFQGVNTLEQARAGRHFKPWSVLGAVLAGFVICEYREVLRESDGWFRLTGWALCLGAVAPVLGYVLFARNGRIRRRFAKVAVFLGLAAGLTVLWLGRLAPLPALLAGLLMAAPPFFPWSSWRRRLRGVRTRGRESRRQKREARARLRAQHQRARRDDQVTALRRSAQRTARALQAQDRRLAALERGEQQERARLTARRAEVAEQVRRIRRTEIERVKAGEAGPLLDPHLGFLMLEVWRVVRADLTAETGGPMIEHDAFFFRVLGDLLDAPDFERRYLHELGRVAVAAINRYLTGRSPLSQVQAELTALEWTPDRLAPLPVPGELVPGLLEAWLVPQRRRQELDRQLFCAGDHPRQDQLNDFFDRADIALPTREEWGRLWDEHPAVFVAR